MKLPAFHYRTVDLPEDEAFERWQGAIGRTYRVHRAHDISRLPRGGLTFHFLDGLIVNRAMFGAQRAVRDTRLIDSTPDHLMLQLWRTGGYRGEIDGKPIALRRGHVVLANRRRTLDLQIAASDTFGLIIPRPLLHGVGVDRFATALDPQRGRLATARLRSLYHLLPQVDVADVPRLSAELLAFVRRLLDPSQAPDVLQARELDGGIVELARRIIAADLDSPALSPETVASRIGVSRASLYRAFAPTGGVMRCAWEMRLDAVRMAIEDPHVRRSLTQLASHHGFASLAHLSRSFRQRFGLSPRDWRQSHRDASREGEDRSGQDRGSRGVGEEPGAPARPVRPRPPCGAATGCAPSRV